MASIKVGDNVPDLTVRDDSGKPVSLSDFRGKPVVLYFYPKDDTSGCTKEACDFRDAFPRFGKIGADVIGISPDSVESHVKFKKKYDLPFKLLADEGHKLADKFGVWKEKSMYGRKFMGIERTTVLIGADGRVVRIFPKVRVPGHVEEVESALSELDRK
jgi:peroxiredoxin Q/BCP